MALTTTVAGASSDSYCSVAEADDFLSWRGSAAWTAASTATKESVLKAAVSVIDNLPWDGARSAETQALRFPTIYMVDTSGAYIIPERVKRAQAYLAMHLLEDPDLLSGDPDVKQVSVPGGFSITTGDNSSSGPADYGLPPDVMDLLVRYLWRSGPVARYWDSPSRSWL